jgi:hypothetical protein
LLRDRYELVKHIKKLLTKTYAPGLTTVTVDTSRTLTQAMENYQRQWNAVFEQKSLASGMDIGRLDSQLNYLARQISDPLIKVLEFISKMGLYLDDHYMMARMVAEKYISDAGHQSP